MTHESRASTNIIPNGSRAQCDGLEKIRQCTYTGRGKDYAYFGVGVIGHLIQSIQSDLQEVQIGICSMRLMNDTYLDAADAT